MLLVHVFGVLKYPLLLWVCSSYMWSVFSSTHCFCGYAPPTCGLCSFLLFTRPCPHRLWSYRFIFLLLLWWFGSRVVSMLDSGTEGPGFKSQSRRCWVTVLGKLFTPIVPLHQAAKLVAALLSIVRVTAGLVESNGSLWVYDSHHLQADCQEPGSAP